MPLSDVALLHLVTPMNRRPLVPPQECRDRRSAPLGLELGKALHPESRASERLGQDLRRKHDSFAAATDKQHLLHATAPSEDVSSIVREADAQRIRAVADRRIRGVADSKRTLVWLRCIG
jgi:hypothetical protein